MPDTFEVLVAQLKAEIRDRNDKWHALANEIVGLQAAMDIVERQRSAEAKRNVSK